MRQQTLFHSGARAVTNFFMPVPPDYIGCIIRFIPKDSELILSASFEEMLKSRLRRKKIYHSPYIENSRVVRFSGSPESLIQGKRWFTAVQETIRSVFRMGLRFTVLIEFDNEVVARLDENTMMILDRRLRDEIRGIIQVDFQDEKVILFIDVFQFEKNRENPLVLVCDTIREFLADSEPDRFAEHSTNRVEFPTPFR